MIMRSPARGNCRYCGRNSDTLLGGFCSPVCDSQFGIYGTVSKKHKIPKCAECGKEFNLTRKDKKFCSSICRSKHHNKCLRKECTICKPMEYKLKADDLFS
jgi:hypothetical protein